MQRKRHTRKVPNFFVIGVVKGGTTSLYHYLNQHEEVYMSPIKETNHFASADMYREQFTHEYALSTRIDLPRYFKRGMPEPIHIAHVDEWSDYLELFSNVTTETVIGEISNSYMVCPSAAGRIHATFPDAKLLVLLRNPISRIWSQYLMNLREGRTAEKDFLNEITSDYKQEVKGWGVTHLYHELGLYAAQIENFLTYFPREQLKVLVFEDYKQTPELVLKEVFEFLGISNHQTIDFSQKMNTAAMPRYKKLNDILVRTGVLKKVKGWMGKGMRQSLKGFIYTDKNIPKMPENAREYLIDFYKKDIARLSQLLHRDFTDLWLNQKQEA